MRLSPPQAAHPWQARRRALVLLVGFIALPTVALGCGAAESPIARPGAGQPLVTGRQGALPVHATGGLRLARRFARAYASGAYRRRPPDLSGETGQVRRALAAAADRVPPRLRRLRPRLRGLRLSLSPDGSILATAEIRAGRSPAFSVAFSVTRRGRRWMVTSISLPG